MRIAFTSCINTGYYPEQPVWDWIAARAPDHLVLLGDSIYLDVGKPHLNPITCLGTEFVQHGHRLYRQLLAQPRFAALVQALGPGRCWSIWDDHDFLWNDALGAEAAANPDQREKMQLSTALQSAFRAALASGLAPGSFPDDPLGPAFWPPPTQPLEVPSIPLAPGLWLHLLDCRTHRTRTWLTAESKRTVLGADQKARVAQAIAAAPGAVHLLATGSTLGAYQRRYARDWQWLTDLAAKHRLLALSGDIHRNQSDGFQTPGFPLHEVTSSGAAIRDAVVAGQRRRNYGLLDVADDVVQFHVYADDKEQTRWARRIDRATWLPLPG